MFKEFKEFAMRGNLIDMAVAFVMGAAFGKVVTAFIDGLVMPIVGKITSGVDFKSLKIIISSAKLNETGKVITPETAIRYGEFITVAIDFVLVAFFMFLLVKTMNKIVKKQEKAPETPAQEKLLTEIRDLLSK